MRNAVRALSLMIALGVFAVSGALAVIRLAPSDPAVWHVVPGISQRTGKSNDWLLAPGGDAPAVALPLRVAQAAAKLDAIALATPGTTRLAGQGPHVTYLTRSRLIGFPDYTSVLITPTATGSALTLYARARFGRSDSGVNRKRAESWVAQLAP